MPLCAVAWGVRGGGNLGSTTQLSEQGELGKHIISNMPLCAVAQRVCGGGDLGLTTQLSRQGERETPYKLCPSVQ